MRRDLNLLELIIFGILRYSHRVVGENDIRDWFKYQLPYHVLHQLDLACDAGMLKRESVHESGDIHYAEA